ncbi:glycoside hydrolase family 71 [Fusarium albosuccineum]|uniref:Glycoside hydrolase family 71 n=1 Tax=Fusarium albosuccineum TaxID=1237068 RepID=A0A8H4PDA7_9HYPO|nr:glycoside hydrolase family 71 [Fusarium albosuccineum]
MSRQVYAHYMVGLTDGQTAEQWQKDISDAQSVGIDGFSLNIGPQDTWTLTQLHQAYAAAEAANFKLFLSFDMETRGSWDAGAVADLINTFKDSGAQVKEADKPLVSTFEGTAWADNWAGVKESTGGIYLVPDWSSIGPDGVRGKLDIVDGAFSWNAWPKAGETKMSSEEDKLYKDVLGDKMFMMGVSPSFYVNLAQWNKNWYSSSESLWYDRWLQVLDVMPQSIQIITWNDFSESSYIADIVPSQVVSGAEVYVDGFSHSALRSVLPYFIQAYKAGTPDVALPNGETAIAWYRTTSATLGDAGGTVWGQGGGESASVGARDVVSVVTITDGEEEVVLKIGDAEQRFIANGTGSRASYFEVPFGDARGDVTLEMAGRTVVGGAITNNMPSTGYLNFNALAIGL